jgi:hypothetical protein
MSPAPQWKTAALTAAFVCCIAGMAPAAGTPGTFVGVLAGDPERDGSRLWLMVQGRNGWIRKVEASRARVGYGPEVPEAQRQNAPRRSLAAGVAVRVTADQDKDGEWRAQRIEILSLAPPPENERARRGAAKSQQLVAAACVTA